MRIAIDLQGLQSEGSRKRGIGRYTFEVINNLLHNHTNHEYVLVANAALADIRYEFRKYLINDKNISYVNWYSPTPLSFISHNKVNNKLSKSLRSYTFNCLHVDIIIITSFFEGFADNCMTDFDFDLLNTPVVTIFYDLIPFLNPDQYLNFNPEFAKYYYNKLDSIKNFQALLAISNSSLKEAIKYLNIDNSKVYNISSACDQGLFNNNPSVFKTLNHLFDDVFPFLLYSGAGDPRKNLKNLLKAYSLLPSKLQEKYHLVLVGKLLSQEIEIIEEWIQDFHLQSNHIHMLGYVSDNDLVSLYRKCSLFVFPSLHEGFGLPVLEAMSCGAPVIGSFSTSIPEIIVIEDAMFDPSDPINIKQLIERSLTDNIFLEKLKHNSIIQSKRFSWDNTIHNLLIACSQNKKANSCKTKISDWSTIYNLNTKNLNNLINQLCIILKDQHDDNLIKIVASSIDKINLDLGLYTRQVLRQVKIENWHVEGPFDSSYSLSILNRSFTRSLDKEINNVSIHITEGEGDYPVDINFLRNFTDIYTKYKSADNLSNIKDVISRNLYPPRVSDMNARINLLHAYGWEESEFPQNWIDDFNSYLQGITVMSSQVKKILIDNGLRIPIKVCGLGIEHLDSTGHSEFITLQAKTFKFLHVSSCFPRKGIDILLEAYCENFTINDKVSLIIKTFNNEHNNIEDLIKTRQENSPLTPDIVLLKEDLSDNQMRYLYTTCDALVAPSRGEGFGLPIAEAMHYGLPVITTGWGGQLDFCNPSNCFLINFKFVLSTSHFHMDLSYWAEPSISHLGDLMLLLYNSDSSLTKQKIDVARATMSKYSWTNVAKENIKFVHELSEKNFNTIPKIGLLSTWNSKCGIASYSKHLLANLEEEVIIFSPLTEDKYSDESLTVIPSWELNSTNEFNFNKIISNLKNLNITTFVIQFNYGFFDFDNFSKFVSEVKGLDINLFIVLHSTSDPAHDSTKKLKYLFNTFKMFDRILVHSISDLNNLKDIGIVENVTLFPHGILDFDMDNIISKNRFLHIVKTRKIASYGFLLPHKGIIQLIEAIDILRNRNFIVALNLFNSIYSPEYSYFYDEVVNKISSLGLSDLINLNTDYLSDDESLNELAMNDLIIFPYQNTNESSSAAVRHGLATGKPVLVTPLDVFDDVRNLVNFSSGISPLDIANGILDWYNSDKGDSYIDTEKKRRSLIKVRSFKNISKRFSSMVHALYLSTKHSN